MLFCHVANFYYNKYLYLSVCAICIVYFNKDKLKKGYVKIGLCLILINEPLRRIENFGMLNDSRKTHFHWLMEDTNDTF